MKYGFLQAGKHKNTDTVFLMSIHRNNYKYGPVHHNFYSTILEIPKELFQANFKFNQKTWVYDNLTNITYGELLPYTKIIEHDYNR